MSYTERFSEVHYPLVAVVPAVYSPAAAVTSAYVSLANYHRAVLVVHCGAIAATGTLDISIRQASSSAGAGVKGIPTTAGQTKLATQLTGADDDSIVIIELRTEELDIANGFEHVAITYDVDTDTAAFSAILYGCEPRFKPVATTNWAEIVD